MATKKRLIDVDRLVLDINADPYRTESEKSYDRCLAYRQPTVDAVEVPCMCCDCFHLLNSKNSFGLYFFCGHHNGLKNIKNTETDFCKYAERRTGDVR